MQKEADIKSECLQGIAILTLNRPQALNALTISMVRKMYDLLTNWAHDSSVRAVLVRSASEKAFCAGGDVRAVWEEARKGHLDQARAFFHAEYRLNHLIYNFPKPYITLLNGITMGGGAGISLHGTYRIAGPALLFAMPETAIGFFPDVGASWFLNKCPGALGTYLALSGARLDAKMCLTAGIATHYVDSEEKMVQLVSALQEVGKSGADIAGVIADHSAVSDPQQQTAEKMKMATINRCFSHDRVEQIMDALEKDGERDFAKSTRATLKKCSPFSLKLSLAQLHRAKGFSFDECLKMEYRLAQACLAPGRDFYEGIRAVLVDKDHNPTWAASCVEAVDDREIAACFYPLDIEELHLDRMN